MIIDKNQPVQGPEQQMPQGMPPQQAPAQPQPQMPQGMVNGFDAAAALIKEQEVQKATLTLQRYKAGKANLERRIIDNEQWYKLRHWECMRQTSKKDIQPASGWLFNALENKHADAMDNFPSANIVPREETDKAEAETLSSIIPVILDENDFEHTFSRVMRYKLKFGTGVYGVFWDTTAANGLGDAVVRKCDLLNLYWEPGIEDIQKSRNFFSVELCDNELLQEKYPQLQGKLGGNTVEVAKYIYDDTVDVTDKSVVIDWYYKKVNSQGKPVVHLCKYVGNNILFASENEQEFRDRGFYDHGEYPFVFDALFETEGTPTGYGFIDIGKDAQEYIDRGNQAILENTLACARPRYFIRNDGSVNEEEYADFTKNFIHVDSNLGADSIVQVQSQTLNDLYVSIINNKVEELKEVTGNRDISTGGTSSGVTAASAIAAMQEAGSKLSRDFNKASYRAFRQVVVLLIELIRQFYDIPRFFRVLGQNGTEKFVMYSNAGIIPKYQGVEMGVDLGYRLPLFDIEVSAQKQSPYSKMSQNELALQFFNAGFFNPQIADQALMTLDMMDFDRKEMVVQAIQKQAGMLQQIQTMQQQMLMMAQMIDKDHGTNLTQQVSAANGEGMAAIGQQGGAMAPQGTMSAEAVNGTGKGMTSGKEALGGSDVGESYITENARKQTAERSAPR